MFGLLYESKLCFWLHMIWLIWHHPWGHGECFHFHFHAAPASSTWMCHFMRSDEWRVAVWKQGHEIRVYLLINSKSIFTSLPGGCLSVRVWLMERLKSSDWDGHHTTCFCLLMYCWHWCFNLSVVRFCDDLLQNGCSCIIVKLFSLLRRITFCRARTKRYCFLTLMISY